MKLDDLNNSQLILLVLLLTIVTSSAMSLAILSILEDKFLPTENEPTPTIIRETVNRIITREEVAVKEEKQDEVVEENQLTLNQIKKSIVKLNFGSENETIGIFISQDGQLISGKFLDEERKYSIQVNDEVVFFSVVKSDKNYSLLKPNIDNDLVIENFIPINTSLSHELGESTLIFGGFGENSILNSEIISQRRIINDEIVLLRTSVNANNVIIPSAVFINNGLVGFISDSSTWVPIISESILENIEKEI